MLSTLIPFFVSKNYILTILPYRPSCPLRAYRISELVRTTTDSISLN